MYYKIYLQLAIINGRSDFSIKYKLTLENYNIFIGYICTNTAAGFEYKPMFFELQAARVIVHSHNDFNRLKKWLEKYGEVENGTPNTVSLGEG